MELALDRFLDDPEQIPCRIANATGLAASRPFVEHRLLQRLVHLTQGDQGTRLLLVLQGEKALGQMQVFSRARYCTYFITYTFITYCTVFVRIPKQVVWRGFAP